MPALPDGARASVAFSAMVGGRYTREMYVHLPFHAIKPSELLPLPFRLPD